jgi:hypothetical protein
MLLRNFLVKDIYEDMEPRQVLLLRYGAALP